jgi:hypothetical protein
MTNTESFGHAGASLADAAAAAPADAAAAAPTDAVSKKNNPR